MKIMIARRICGGQLSLIEVSSVIDFNIAVGEKAVEQVSKIIVRHTCYIVSNNLIFLFVLIRRSALVTRGFYVFDMVRENKRIAVVLNQTVKQAVVDKAHHRLNRFGDVLAGDVARIYKVVIVLLRLLQRRKVLLIR